MGTAGTVVAAGRGLLGAPTSIVVGSGLAPGVDVVGGGSAVTVTVSRVPFEAGAVEAMLGWVSGTTSTGGLWAGNFVVTGAPHAVAAITSTKMAAWRMFVDTGMSRIYSTG